MNKDREGGKGGSPASSEGRRSRRSKSRGKADRAGRGGRGGPAGGHGGAKKDAGRKKEVGGARDKTSRRDRSGGKGTSGKRGVRPGSEWKGRRDKGAIRRKSPAFSLGAVEGLVSGNRAWIAFCAFILVLWVVYFHDVFFGGNALVSPDAVAPAGVVKVGKESLEAGVYPLWNPYVFCGMPSFASLSYNPHVYPVGLVLGAIGRVLPIPMLGLLSYYLAGGLGLFLLLRKQLLPAGAAAFGAVAFMFTPNLIAVGAHGHGSQLMASMYIPFIFLLTQRTLERGSLGYAAGLAITFGLQLLRGHVQISYYTAIMIGLMALYWTVRGIRDRGIGTVWKPLSLTVLAVVLALGIAGALYIPVHNYSDLSVRSAGEHGGLGIARAGQWSLSPKETGTFLLPSLFGFGSPTYWGDMPFTDYPNYMGILTLLLAIYGAVGLRRDKTVGFLTLLAVLALLLSFGRHLGPIYEAAYRWLPFFNKFRVPVMVVVVLQFSVACLAGYGLSLLWKRDPKGGRKSILPWCIGVLALGMIFFLAGQSAVRGAYLDWMGQSAKGQAAIGRGLGDFAFGALRTDVLVVGIVAIAAMLLAEGARRRRVSVGILALGLLCLTCVDLWRVDYRLMASTVRPRGEALKELEEDPVALHLAKDKDLFRVYPLGREFSSNKLVSYGLAVVGGYHAAKPKLWDRWANAHTDGELWTSAGRSPRELGKDMRLPYGLISKGERRMLNVKYFVVTGRPVSEEDLEPVFHDGDTTVYLYTDWLPRAFCVGRTRTVGSSDDALREVLTPSFDPEAYAVVEGRIDSPPQGVGTAEVTSYGANHVEVKIATSAPTFLVVSDLFMEGWEAFLDGEKVPIHKTNFMFRGVSVPAGEHGLRMQYFDPGLALGLKLGVGCAIVIAGMAAPSLLRGVGSLRRRRSQS